MIGWLKRILYFSLASYFRFFAAIRLKFWKPTVVVVTGSNGKTTLLHLLEAQLGDKAKYSHHANSSFGIPFDILDLNRKSLFASEWVSLFLMAPLNVFKKIPQEKIYVVEADADRPYEGKFLAELLKPEVVLWVSTAITHSMNFDNLVSAKIFKNVEEAIAYEYGYFLEYCKKLVVINGDSDLQNKQVNRTKARLKAIEKEKLLKKYDASTKGTKFIINENHYDFKHLLPEDIFYSIEMCRLTIEYFNLPFDNSFKHFIVPPGRGSIFEGIKDTILIDSTYNANLSSNKVMLKMFTNFPVKQKWLVLSDMLELGEEEKEEHERLAEILSKMDLDKIILLGDKTAKYTYPSLSLLLAKRSDLVGIISFKSSRDVKDYLLKNIRGGESILFKGSQSMFLEGVIEALLKNKSDAKFLPRRGEFWERKRKQAGL